MYICMYIYIYVDVVICVYMLCSSWCLIPFLVPSHLWGPTGHARFDASLENATPVFASAHDTQAGPAAWAFCQSGLPELIRSQSSFLHVITAHVVQSQLNIRENPCSWQASTAGFLPGRNYLIFAPQGRAGVLHLRMRVKCEFLNFESTQAVSFIHVDLVHPCQFVPIDLAPRASQAKKRQTLLCAAAGDATYAIGFGPCRILLLFFLFAKIRKLNEAMAGTTRNAVFFEVRASWIILGYFCIRIRVPELCQE